MQTPDDVLAQLARGPAMVRALAADVPPDDLRRRPREGKWSAHEHACHLAAVHDLFFHRLDQILASPRPIITPYDPGTSDPPDALLAVDLEQALTSYEADRRRVVARLRQLRPEDWSRTAEHGEYSHYSVLIMFRHLALHDFFHAYRIEELLLAREWADEWRAASGVARP